jgi:LmbE family N-acetylglucosaminyl deacetylase
MTTIVFLSPHLDDVVLSCGGTINRLRQYAVAVHVMTIFAGDPTGELSPLAKMMHQAWKLPYDAPAYRRKENSQAVTSLGGRESYLPFPCSIYRRDFKFQAYLYTSKAEIFSGDYSKEPEMLVLIQKELQRRLAEQSWELLIAPMGVGNHVDHVLVRSAVMRAFSGTKIGDKILFYEDFPYVQQPGALHATIDHMGMQLSQCTIVPLTEGDISAKQRAFQFYTSQTKEVAGELGISTEEIREYNSLIAPQKAPFAERYWSSQTRALSVLLMMLNGR